MRRRRVCKHKCKDKRDCAHVRGVIEKVDKENCLFWEDDEVLMEKRIPEQEKRLSQVQSPQDCLLFSSGSEDEMNENDMSFKLSELKGSEERNWINRRIKVWWSDDDGDRWE